MGARRVFLLTGCALLGLACSLTLATDRELSGGSADAGMDVSTADVVTEVGAHACTPGEVRSCGASGSQTCGPAGFWCSCLSDAPGTCTGTGTYVGCRGDGCLVCQEKVAAFPCYFKNHPGCALNTTCGGMFYTCSTLCPAPTAEDACNCTASGTWSNCVNSPCSICTDKTTDYSCYFANHPTCIPQNNCAGSRMTCSQFCPLPTPEDKGHFADGGLVP
jgi:hypothetical protein